MEKKVLVVEDDEDTGDLLKTIVEIEGYHVTTAEDGRDALERLQESTTPFDLIITGIAMPGMSGDEMIHIIRKTDKDIPILVISGGRYERGCELVKEGLVIDCMPKPFKVRSLANMINLLISDNMGTC